MAAPYTGKKEESRAMGTMTGQGGCCGPAKKTESIEMPHAAIVAGSKVHISINTDRFNETVAFYKALFSTEPVKHYDNYAKFDLAQPGLNLAINGKPKVDRSAAEDQRPLNHFGIELASSAQVRAAIERFYGLAFKVQVEQEVECCHGIQDKVWVKDPNGHLWEIFAVLVADTGPGAGSCCVPTNRKEAEISPCCATAPEAKQRPEPVMASR